MLPIAIADKEYSIGNSASIWKRKKERTYNLLTRKTKCAWWTTSLCLMQFLLCLV